MRKIFYNPKTLRIMGMSDGENSLDFPFVDTEIPYHSTENLEIIKEEGIFKLKVKYGYWDEVYDKEGNRIIK